MLSLLIQIDHIRIKPIGVRGRVVRRSDSRRSGECARSLQETLVVILISYAVGYDFVMNVLTCEIELLAHNIMHRPTHQERLHFL